MLSTQRQMVNSGLAHDGPMACANLGIRNADRACSDIGWIHQMNVRSSVVPELRELAEHLESLDSGSGEAHLLREAIAETASDSK